jgi:RimJ/RimL family protein N-acetyltransferase
MLPEHNHLGQLIGFAVPAWTPPLLPPREPMMGRYCCLEPLDPDRHAAELHAANDVDSEQRMWTYLSYGPFDSLETYQTWMRTSCMSRDPLFFAIVDSEASRAGGVASYLRIDPLNGSIEVGHLAFSPCLQRTRVATEAMYLMMKQAFELGYRRYEWKCDALNAPSRAAAERLGFAFEGVFRQATVYKKRNRDTAWYAVIDQEWPGLQAAFDRWLDPANFDEHSGQKSRLAELTASIRR